MNTKHIKRIVLLSLLFLGYSKSGVTPDDLDNPDNPGGGGNPAVRSVFCYGQP